MDWQFEHVEPEIFYPGDVSAGFEECTQAHDDKHCAEQYWNVPIDLLYIKDHLDYMGVQTSPSGCVNSADAVIA